MKEEPTTRVLLVEPSETESRLLGGWLEEAGLDVLACPGPRAPGYDCLGGSGLPCPLAQDADVVVLDLHLATDEAMRGPPGWHLLLYYVERGRPVVALVGPEDPVTPRPDETVAVLRRPADRRELLDAVQRLTHAPAAGSR